LREFGVCTVLHLVGKENNGIPPVTNNLCNLPLLQTPLHRDLRRVEAGSAGRNDVIWTTPAPI
jgi:hypothetical protein